MSEADAGPDQVALLREIVESLHELLIWTRVVGYPTIKQTLETTLDSNAKRLVYHLSDGQRTVSQIQRLTGVNVRFISQWGHEWERIGIVEQSQTKIKGRRQKVFDLATYGIAVPDRTASDDGEEQVA